MYISKIDADSFNPRILYLGRESYISSNSLSSHFHPFSVIMFVLDVVGECKYRIEGKTFEIETGSIIICNPAVYHEKIIAPGGNITELHLAFDGIHSDGAPPNSIIKSFSHIVTNTGKLSREFGECFNESLNVNINKFMYSEILIKSIAIKLIALCLQRCYEDIDDGIIDEFKPLKSKMSRVVQNLRKFIYENYNKEIYLDNISSELHLSSSYLSKVFKQETGMSPVNYQISLRLSMARELLRKGSYSIKNTAKNVGYDDSYYFSKLFKKYFGLSPLAYKNKQS